MVRKDPYKRISVADRIYEVLERKRQQEYAGAFRIPPMNAYCEQVLWDYALGKIGYLGKDVTEQMNAFARGELPKPAPNQSESSHWDALPPLEHSVKKPGSRHKAKPHPKGKASNE